MPTPLIERKRQIETLKPLYRSMARALLFGASPGTLADRFGLTPPRVSEIIHSPLFQAEYRRLEDRTEDIAVDTIREELEGLRPRAVEVLAEELMQSNPTARRTKCAFELLDRTDFYSRKPKDDAPVNQFQFIMLSPLPGEDPIEAEKRITAIKEIVHIKQEEETVDAQLLEEVDSEPPSN